ncbi:MAG: hypothetical protein PHU85_02160 [Phycisphaerae bacterium]|nr:hypothetical protein [Phycisphaerae bacterium]
MTRQRLADKWNEAKAAVAEVDTQCTAADLWSKNREKQERARMRAESVMMDARRVVHELARLIQNGFVTPTPPAADADGLQAAVTPLADQVDRWIVDVDGCLAARLRPIRTGNGDFDFRAEGAVEREKSREGVVVAGKTIAAALVSAGQDAQSVLTLVNALDKRDYRQARKDWPTIKPAIQEAAIRLRLRGKATRQKAEPDAPQGNGTAAPAGPAPASAPVAPITPPPANSLKLSKEAKALAALTDHPDWSNATIAKAAGCHVKSLSRMADFQRARQILASGRADMPRGSKDKDGTLEAESER